MFTPPAGLHATDSLAHADACRNCGRALEQQRYCGQCGQDSHAGHAPTLKHFGHDLVHEVLHLDGTIWRTLRALFLEPGRLTAEYWDGRIKQWIRPVRLFLTAVAAHLLLGQAGVGPLNLRMRMELTPSGGQSIAFGQDLSTIPVKPGNTLAPPERAKAYLDAFSKRYASIRYLSVLALATVAFLLLRRRQPYFVNHLIFGLHFYAVWYLVALPGAWSTFLSKLVVPLSLLYLVLAVRRAHDMRWVRSIAVGSVLFFTVIAAELGLALAASGATPAWKEPTPAGDGPRTGSAHSLGPCTITSPSSRCV